MATCSNFGQLIGDNCVCPSGFGGKGCTDINCNNSLTPPESRKTIPPNQSTCGDSCTVGWTGPNCEVCQLDAACGSSTGQSGFGNSETLICSKSQIAYTSQFVTCNVLNPTLQSIYPGITTLNLQKSPVPSLSSSPFLGSKQNSFLAQLFYAKNSTSALEEEFYCQADTCVQTESSSSVDYVCQNLKCECIGQFWCTRSGAADLSTTINELDGQISISCTSNSTCFFKQSTLQTLFGPNGLSLSECNSGECVKKSTIDTLRNNIRSVTAQDRLSSGVIAALVVIGLLLLSLLTLFGFGYRAQYRARRAGNSRNENDGNMGGVGLRWTDIGYTLPSKKSIFGKSIPGRSIIHDISGEVLAGKFLTILGPSGAGKSSLLECLAGKSKSGISSGHVELLGSNNASIAYVDQDPILPPHLTIKEALQFTCELKFGDSVSKRDKENRVEEVLNSLGLSHVQDTRIGNLETGGISGGERRRLSIGLAILAPVSILFTDEITSGLDSSSAFAAVSVLRSLSKSTTIIATIHQPNPRIYQLFDQVLLLGGGGKLLYQGEASQAGDYFAKLGRPTPSGWGIADHLLDIATESFSIEESYGTRYSSPKLMYAPDSSGIELTPPLSQSEKAVLPFSTSIEHIPVFIPSKSQHPFHSNTKPATVFLTQLQLLAKRQYLELSRDSTLLVQHLLVSIVLGLFVGGIYYKTGITIGGFQSRIGSLFFLGSLIAFSSLSALSIFSSNRLLFLRERSENYYSPTAFILTRIVFDVIPLRILPTVIMSTIVYWMVGLNPHALEYFKFLFILIFYAIVTTLINLLLATLISKTGVAILFSSVFNLLEMAFAGFFVSISSVPPVLRWLQYLDPLRYTLEALTVNEVNSGLMIVDVLAGVKVEVSASLIMQTLFGFDPNAYGIDLLALFAFIVGLLALVIGSVYWKLKEIR